MQKQPKLNLLEKQLLMSGRSITSWFARATAAETFADGLSAVVQEATWAAEAADDGGDDEKGNDDQDEDEPPDHATLADSTETCKQNCFRLFLLDQWLVL